MSTKTDEYAIWTPFLTAGARSLRAVYRIGNQDVTAEIIPDMNGEMYLWGVRFPAKRYREAGRMVVEIPERRVGGKCRIEDEDGSLHIAKTIREAKDRCERAIGRKILDEETT